MVKLSGGVAEPPFWLERRVGVGAGRRVAPFELPVCHEKHKIKVKRDRRNIGIAEERSRSGRSPVPQLVRNERSVIRF